MVEVTFEKMKPNFCHTKCGAPIHTDYAMVLKKNTQDLENLVSWCYRALVEANSLSPLGKLLYLGHTLDSYKIQHLLNMISQTNTQSKWGKLMLWKSQYYEINGSFTPKELEAIE